MNARKWGAAFAFPASIAAACLVLHAQQPTPFRSGVNFVRVDVIPTDKSGAFISTLTQDDFDVSELGKRQKIDTFDKVMLDGGLMSRDHPPEIRNEDDERREAARADVRLFGIFLDDYHVSRESSLQTRDILSRFIATDLGPSDLVELMTPRTPLTSAILTGNHEAVERQIEQFLGRKGNYDDLVNAAEENVFRECKTEPACIEQVRNEVALSALQGFITHFSAYKDARKTMILVTEGFAGGLRELDVQELSTDANRGNVSVYWIDPRRLNAMSPGAGEWLWDDRCDCLMWRAGPVSLRSITLQQDPLRALTLYTDGRTLVTNDLLPAMKQIVTDMSGYYLLGYTSTLDASDGKFHEIAVRVKRPGVSVRARKGYWAYTKSEVAAATAPPKPAPPGDVASALNVLAAAERTPADGEHATRHGASGAAPAREGAGALIVVRAGSAVALRELRASPDPASSAGRVFRRGEHVLVRARVVNPDAHQVAAALLNPAGDHLLNIPIERTDGGVECELPLASLAAGTYLLEITGADVTSRTLLAFRVEN